MAMQDITHLGDGAYVMSDGYQVWLAANDHLNPSVALDPQALIELMKWVKEVMPEIANIIDEQVL